LGCSFDFTFGLLRRTRPLFSTKERTELQGAIEILKSVWLTQRIWETKTASVTLKSHDLWFKVQPQLTYLGRSYHFMEDKLHKIDRLMDAIYCHLRDYKFREESKKKKELIGKNSRVQKQLYEVTQSRKRKFATATLLKKEETKSKPTLVKRERRSFEGAAL
jgi:hypothetical protein